MPQSSQSTYKLTSHLRVGLLPSAFYKNIGEMRAPELAYIVLSQFLGHRLEAETLKKAADQSLSFDIPVKPIDRNRCVMELFHGPTATFHDLPAALCRNLEVELGEKLGSEANTSQIEGLIAVASMVILLFQAKAKAVKISGQKNPAVRIFLPFGCEAMAIGAGLARKMGLNLGDISAPNKGSGEFVEYVVEPQQRADTMLTLYNASAYLLDPDGAGAYAAMDAMLPHGETGIALLPFHPSVKAEEVEAAIGVKPVKLKKRV